MGAMDFMEPIVRNAMQNQVRSELDYIGSDGLLFCGKCHTPKETRIDVEGISRKFPIVCKCRQEAQERMEAEERRQKDLQEVSKLKSSSLMDKKFRESTFTSFRTTKHNGRNLRLCRRYVDGFSEMVEKNQGLLFYGDVGTGKSYAAACIANELMDKKIPVVMTSFVKILELIQNSKGGEEEQYIRRMNRAKLLIVDDLGAERSTDFALEKVYNIVDSRYRAKLPMVLTTNLSLRDMQECKDIRYSRIYDRIFEVCYPMEFTGPSWRKVEASRRFDEMRQFLEES